MVIKRNGHDSLCVRDWPQVSSVHDGHHQTQLCFGLEGVSQRHDESTVNSSQDPFLHHGTLWEQNNTSVTDDLQLDKALMNKRDQTHKNIQKETNVWESESDMKSNKHISDHLSLSCSCRLFNQIVVNIIYNERLIWKIMYFH